ncbi:bifunctional 4-hydroxy-2-oxoglutarate aldolase/2-dehydro-3-deoxy-phosphogluconate aldolase [Antribacter gilvus]|uniref:bifunctional 4-hydroxy-2-oxoglutarate aldolase/2-dehydro-3-deoxy-phosphogluconate aldolase n=1 Tax=Antribacter gilvus TaxID=2304675 RepID=UPI000F7A8AE6|nr:bifunctional 4-hydroxy-2-oxoglutarate aldolase/2-dehydro-3-deoxy-phosphogluconate aldolase [Antribacter gilvus]
MTPARAIRESRLIAILRTSVTAHIVAVAEVLASEGVHVLEIPLTSAESLTAITDTTKQLGERAYVGAGTVRTVDDARRAIDAGAAFLVAPGLSLPVLDYAQKRGVLLIPGAFTPTEVDTAARSGAELVKLFPANSHSPEYVRQLRAPLPDAGLIPMGGITLDDARAWLDAGAVALGIGSPIVGDSLATGMLDTARSNTRAWLERIG